MQNLIQLYSTVKLRENVFVCKTGSFIMPETDIISPSQFTGRKKILELHDP